MKYLPILVIIILCISVISVSSGKETTPKATLQEILKSYEQLKSELDKDVIGDSIKKLKTFQKKYVKYEVSNTVSKDISELLKQVKGRYHIARELARKGELERAEKILITDSGFSLIAVGNDGKTRLRVTQDEIEKAD